jgi:hypothetical protein
MRISLLALTLIFLAGCQSEPAVMFSPAHAGPALATCKNPSPGAAPAGAVGNLRQPEMIKVYGMNRYVDAGDSHILHERHAIYRLEQQPAWITRSPKKQNGIILGPVVGLREPEYAPEPLPGETSREIFQARRGIEEANEGMKEVRESQERLTSSVETIARNTAEAERKLTAVVSVLNERVKHLEGDNSNPSDEPPQAKTSGAGQEDVVIRSPNP